jgi:hypothetical protein
VRIRSLQLFILAGTDIQSRHRFSSSSLWQARATTSTSQGRLDPRLPWQLHDTHLYKIHLIDIALPLRSDKNVFDIPGWRDERIIDTSTLFISIPKNNSFGYGAPASKDGGSGLFFRLLRNGRFPRRFCILIKPAFCIGVSRRSFAGLLFFLSRYHTFGVWACSFLITEAATFPIVTTKSLAVHGSTSFIKEKEYRHIERLFEGTGWGCLFCDLGVLDLLGGYMGNYLVSGVGWQRHCSGFVVGESQEPVFPDRFGGGAGCGVG